MNIPNELDEYFKAVDKLLNKKDDGMRKETFDNLFEWFSNRGNRRSIAARKELRRRLDYLPYEEQKKFLHALLDGGRMDRSIAFHYLTSNWDNEYEQEVIALWQKYSEVAAGRLIVYYADANFVYDNQDALIKQSTYMKVCKRLAKFPDFNIDKNRLMPNDYISIMSRNHLPLGIDDAKETVYLYVAKAIVEAHNANMCTMRYESNETVLYPTMLCLTGVKRMFYSIRELGLLDKFSSFFEWEAECSRKCSLSPKDVDDSSRIGEIMELNYRRLLKETFPKEYEWMFYPTTPVMNYFSVNGLRFPEDLKKAGDKILQELAE